MVKAHGELYPVCNFLQKKGGKPWKSNPVWLNFPWIKSQQETTQSRRLTSGLSLYRVILGETSPRQ